MTATFQTAFHQIISFRLSAQTRRKHDAQTPSNDADLARRRFISDKLESCPDAITSEFGMSALMSHYPNYF